MNNIVVFGSTGSIGRTTLSIVRKYPDFFRIKALSAGRNINLLRKQVKTFSPAYVTVIDDRDRAALQREFPRVRFFSGSDGLGILAQLKGVDLVVMAIVGLDALIPTYLALKARRRIALASKEVMVAAGNIIKSVHGSDELLIPVDSEHSAIYQLLHGEAKNPVRRILLTASGGPFLKTAPGRLQSITPEQALHHPRWKMGKKITVDSATMMNKGLEMIEAKWLFNLKPRQIEVVIHPQSIIHSMVEFEDGAVLAQMGVPDMRLPIAYAMHMRKRLATGTRRLDFTKIRSLDFIRPDLKKFKCLRIARDVMKEDGSSAVVMNAANDTAVEAFLSRRIRFTDIADIVEYAVNRHYYTPIRSVRDIIALDGEVKLQVKERIQKLCSV